MRTLEQRAQDFTSSGEYTPTLKECYIAGAAEEYLLLTHWNSIDEDKDGFATEDAWQELWDNRPALIKDMQDNSYFVLQEPWQFADYSNDICKAPRHFKWRKIHE